MRPIRIFRRGSRILKWGVNFSTSIREIREINYYFNIWGIRKKGKKGTQKKRGGGGGNSPISPPLDPRLIFKQNKRYKTLSQLFCILYFFISSFKSFLQHSQMHTHIIHSGPLYRYYTHSYSRNSSWQVWRSVSSRPGDSSETFQNLTANSLSIALKVPFANWC